MKIFSRAALASICASGSKKLRALEPVSSSRWQGWVGGFCNMLQACAKPLGYEPVRAPQGMPMPQVARRDGLLAMALAYHP